jgi:hypothetical protein
VWQHTGNVLIGLGLEGVRLLGSTIELSIGCIVLGYGLFLGYLGRFDKKQSYKSVLLVSVCIYTVPY